MGATRSERSKSDHKEMETGEGDHVDGQLPEVGVELTGETETGGNTGHDGRHKVVQVTVRGRRKLQGPHADIVKSLVVDTERLIRVLNCIK